MDEGKLGPHGLAEAKRVMLQQRFQRLRGEGAGASLHPDKPLVSWSLLKHDNARDGHLLPGAFVHRCRADDEAGLTLSLLATDVRPLGQRRPSAQPSRSMHWQRR